MNFVIFKLDRFSDFNICSRRYMYVYFTLAVYTVRSATTCPRLWSSRLRTRTVTVRTETEAVTVEMIAVTTVVTVTVTGATETVTGGTETGTGNVETVTEKGTGIGTGQRNNASTTLRNQLKRCAKLPDLFV